jgi:cholesterol oxidase
MASAVISGCRLAEAGYKVLILERGRRWTKETYPRKPGDAWVWNHDHPEKENDWMDLRLWPNMGVATGAAVGGGSLIYANISCEAPKAVFDIGWPPEITYDELKPTTTPSPGS